MQEGDALPLGPDAWGLIDQSETGGATALEGAVEVVDVKAEVMDPRTTLGKELPDGGVCDGGFEELDERIARREPDDARPIGVIERHLGEPVQLSIER